MEDYYLPQDFDTVKVVLLGPVHLRIIAEAANTYYRKIRELNPEFKGYYLPQGEYTIRVPKGSGEKFPEQFEAKLKEYHCEEKAVYIVKEGDNLSQIAESLNVSLASLKEWNKIDDPNLIKPGQELIYYRPLFK
jgi:nucleoid-associated protein YgaU